MRKLCKEIVFLDKKRKIKNMELKRQEAQPNTYVVTFNI